MAKTRLENHMWAIILVVVTKLQDCSVSGSHKH